jgi:hypothetical protein
MWNSDSWKLQPSRQAVVRKWYRGILVLFLSLLLVAFATAVETSKRSDRGGPAAISGAASLHSGGGNLIPVF